MHLRSELLEEFLRSVTVRVGGDRAGKHRPIELDPGVDDPVNRGDVLRAAVASNLSEKRP